MKCSRLIAALRDDIDTWGDLEVRFPGHGAVRGTCAATDGDDPKRPLVVFLLEDADLI